MVYPFISLRLPTTPTLSCHSFLANNYSAECLLGFVDVRVRSITGRSVADRYGNLDAITSELMSLARRYRT